MYISLVMTSRGKNTPRHLLCQLPSLLINLTSQKSEIRGETLPHRFTADPQQACDEAGQGHPALQLPPGDGHPAARTWKIPDDAAASLRRVP